ncbi:MAG: polyprenyl synthetase family protein [Chlamydiales bacterium]|nr:polyprenyl synthetase family protein [Chlamydiales bacterium]
MIDLINKELEILIPASSPYYSSLLEGARYSLLAPGKRIRPLLTIYTAKALDKGSYELALRPACALELVHCYSLIHDDLPSMDNDDFRRGKPTLHRAYNEGLAILVGDYLLTHAFDILSSSPGLSAEQKVALVAALARAAGGDGMIGGQVMDIEEHRNLSELHRRKTAALFRCAMEFGGLISGASSSTLEKLERFGDIFGKLFQVVDDILDGDHPAGEQKAQEAMNTLKTDALNALETLPGDTSSLKNLILTVSKQPLLKKS